MIEKAFYHEVVAPTTNLLTRAAENVCVEPDCNDVISLAKQVASAAYHFRETALRKSGKDKLGPMTDPTAEALRQSLGDVVDSAKHGRLRNPERHTTFRASLAFEYDQTLGFRFLRTEVLVTNKRFGTFELSDTVLEFIPLLGDELNVHLRPEGIKLQPQPFSEWAETYLTPKSGFNLEGVGIRIYQRNANDALTLFDPPEVKFRVMSH